MGCLIIIIKHIKGITNRIPESVTSISLNNNDLAKYLPSIGIFVVFFFRLIPLFNKITIAFQNIQYSKPAVNEIIKVLELEVTYDADKLKKLKFENEIKVKN